ncbi:MAG: hypothetical protein MZV70_37480 [Desulfobacterales bacterium]|nr:hypothetical protein [Desulfobacterales bacterium]
MAEVAAANGGEDELYELRAPRLALPRPRPRRLRRGRAHAGRGLRHAPRPALRAYLHRDARAAACCARGAGARLTALTSGGAIPDNADYQVVLEPDEHRSSARSTRTSPSRAWPGDIFQLGNTLVPHPARSRRGTVRVEDASGAPPNIPFWLGEAPGAHATSCRRRWHGCAARSTRGCRVDATRSWPRRLADAASCSSTAAAARSSPTTWPRPWRALGRAADARHAVVLERFFDETGGTQLVVHSPVRQPHQPRLGPGAAQALLPQVQLRAAGGGHRGLRSCCRSATTHSFPLDEVRAATCAQPACARCWCRRCSRHRCSPPAGAGTRRSRWRCRASAAAARYPPQLQRMRGRGPDRRGVPGSARLRREPRRRARGAGPSAGRPDAPRLPGRGDGHRRPRAPARSASRPATVQVAGARPAEPSPLAHEDPQRRGPTPSSTTRRSRSGAPRR